MKRLLLIFSTILCFWSLLPAAEGEAPKSKPARDDFDDFISGANKEWQNALNAADSQYVDLLEKSWQEFVALAPDTLPRWRKKPMPIKSREEDGFRREDDKRHDDVVIVPPPPQPRPEPTPNPAPTPNPDPAPHPPVIPPVTFNLYGQQLTVKNAPKVSLPSQVSQSTIADTWKQLDNASAQALVDECLAIKSQMNLCDWSFIELVKNLASAKCQDQNSKAMLAGFLLKKCGYDVKYALINGGQVDVLFATDHIIYDVSFSFDNGTRYYPMFNKQFGSFVSYQVPDNMRGKSVDLMPKTPILDSQKERERKLATFDVDPLATVKVQDGLMKFYESYPKCAYGKNFVSRWVICARAPLSKSVSGPLYQALRKEVAGKTPFQAVDIILSLCQRSFPYGYDDEIWGGDRAFFPDESIYYPKSDCEDHAILFSRMINDILGYDVALVYVPGHLFAAVNFPDGADISGDYFSYNGKRYYVCEPTCSGHMVPGRSGVSLDNAQLMSVFR